MWSIWWQAAILFFKWVSWPECLIWRYIIIQTNCTAVSYTSFNYRQLSTAPARAIRKGTQKQSIGVGRALLFFVFHERLLHVWVVSKLSAHLATFISVSLGSFHLVFSAHLNARLRLKFSLCLGATCEVVIIVAQHWPACIHRNGALLNKSLANGPPQQLWCRNNCEGFACTLQGG